MKISVITATYNSGATLADTLRSVASQSYPQIEHIVIDGASTDNTLQVVREFGRHDLRLISEPDHGIYDALNKGLALTTGDVVGIMHSDDFFADDQVLANIMLAFESPAVDAVYGDLDYVARDNADRVVRRWRSGTYTPDRLARGWMPPHPTLYLRRTVIERLGDFDTSYRIAADYDAVLRYFGRGGVRPLYIPRVLVKMRLGGASNGSILQILRKTREDYRALQSNDVGGVAALAWKNLSKIGQFI